VAKAFIDQRSFLHLEFENAVFSPQYEKSRTITA